MITNSVFPIDLIDASSLLFGIFPFLINSWSLFVRLIEGVTSCFYRQVPALEETLASAGLFCAGEFSGRLQARR